MIWNVSTKPKWLNLPLAVVLGLSAIGVAVNSFYFVVDHYSWTLDNAIGTTFFERTIRGPVKEFFDTHFFITILTFLCIPVFGVTAIIIAYQWIHWSGEFNPDRHRLLRGSVYAVCVIPLVFVGWVIGGLSANIAIWLAPLTLTAAALLGEISCPPRHLSWLRPLIWGAALGAVAELAK